MRLASLRHEIHALLVRLEVLVAIANVHGARFLGDANLSAVTVGHAQRERSAIHVDGHDTSRLDWLLSTARETSVPSFWSIQRRRGRAPYAG